MRTILVHGASIGELLAAEPVVARLRAARPDIAVVYSYTSRSVERWPAWPADALTRLPFPMAPLARRWFRHIDPSLVVLSRGDLWPAMLDAARHVPVAVIGGRIRPGSARLRWPWRGMLASRVRRFAHVGVVSDEDASRWQALGALPERIVVNGDPDVDRLLERRPDAAVVEPLRAWAGDEPVLVFGSVEPSDREAVRRLLGEAPRAIVVPHDPERPIDVGEATVWEPGTPVPSARRLIVRRRGCLADCYHVARAAYVGGGFRGRPHSVREPAAAAVPVLMGPTGVAGLAARWREWRDDVSAARTRGTDDRRRLGAAAGAAARATGILQRFLA